MIDCIEAKSFKKPLDKFLKMRYNESTKRKEKIKMFVYVVVSLEEVHQVEAVTTSLETAEEYACMAGLIPYVNCAIIKKKVLK